MKFLYLVILLCVGCSGSFKDPADDSRNKLPDKRLPATASNQEANPNKDPVPAPTVSPSSEVPVKTVSFELLLTLVGSLKPKVITYQDVKGLLNDGSSQKKYCVACHKSPNPSENLNLESFPFQLAGDASEQRAIVQSMIARMKDQDNPMPPKYKKWGMLAEKDVALFQSWLDGGLLVTPSPETQLLAKDHVKQVFFTLKEGSSSQTIPLELKDAAKSLYQKGMVGLGVGKTYQVQIGVIGVKDQKLLNISKTITIDPKAELISFQETIHIVTK